MGFGFKQPLVGEKRCVTTLITAAEETSSFAFVTRRPYCPGRPKKLCFTTLSLAPTVLTARLSVVKQSFFGLLGQYGRRVTKANAWCVIQFLIANGVSRRGRRDLP